MRNAALASAAAVAPAAFAPRTTPSHDAAAVPRPVFGGVAAVAVAVCVGLASTAGCALYEDRATQLRYDPAALRPAGQAGDFWALPLPSDARLEEDGAVDLENWPGDWDSELVKMWLTTAHERSHGWGLSTGGFFQTTGDVDAASLPSPAETLADGAAVFLVDIDERSPEYGKRFPLEVEYREDGDTYAPPRLLSASPVPGFVRRSSTTYAFVVTDAVRDVSGAPLGPSRAFFDALTGGTDAALQPLARFLDAHGIDKASVAGAAVFTTEDADAELLELAAFEEALPEPEITTPFQKVDETDDFTVWLGGTAFPVVQTGQRPYKRYGEGLLARDADGRIAVVDHQDVRVTLTIPKTPMPAAGYPTVIYMHGSGGDAWEGIDLGPGVCGGGPEAPRTGPAQPFARKGVAMIATDFPLHGTRNDPPDEDGLLLYNILGNVDATIDNFHVAAMEQMILSRLVAHVVVDGDKRLDPAHISAMGFSMGTSIGVPFMAVDPRVTSFVGAGAGGDLVEIAVSAQQPYPLKPQLQTVIGMQDGEELHRAHPLLHAFQTLWDLVDPIVKAKRLVIEPYDGVPRKNVFLSAGYLDGYFSPRSTSAMAVAMGTPLAGDAAEPTLPDTLALANRSPVRFPVDANLDGKTAAVLSYDGTGPLRGHYVLFDREDARQQYTSFVATGAIDAAP